jgi:hypothetical protein
MEGFSKSILASTSRFSFRANIPVRLQFIYYYYPQIYSF